MRRKLRLGLAVGALVWVLAAVGSAAAVGATVVPPSASGAIRAFAGKDAYIPTFLPSGYHYVSWKNESEPPYGAPSVGKSWFEVTFSDGAAVLTWDVEVESQQQLPCGLFSTGDLTYAGRTAYWSNTNPSGGRSFWTCVHSATGRILFVTIVESHAKLDTTIGAKMAASAKLTTRRKR